MSKTIIKTSVENWQVKGNQTFLEDGILVDERNKMELSRFLKVPGTLVQVDKKFGTRTFLDVLLTQEPASELQAIIEEVDGKLKLLSFIDPKSTFISDETFNIMVEAFQKLKLEPVEAKVRNSASRRVVFDLHQEDSDNFMADAFKRQIVLDRLPQGGSSLSLDTIRLICTNGAKLSDKQFSRVSRNNVFDEQIINTFTSDMLTFRLNEYLENLWKRDGEFIEASVADYYNMRHTLATLVDEEAADIFYPTWPIEDHYSAQDIDLSKINNHLRSRMPSGISYYDCFNILTNGIKQAGPLTMEEQIAVARYAKPAIMKQVRESDIHWEGKPHFELDRIKVLMGDQGESEINQIYTEHREEVAQAEKAAEEAKAKEAEEKKARKAEKMSKKAGKKSDAPETTAEAIVDAQENAEQKDDFGDFD